MLKQRDKQTVTQSRQCRRWAGPACHLGGLGGGLPPCTLASWLVLKHWLKITHCLGAATAAGLAVAAKGAEAAGAGTSHLLGLLPFGSSAQLATAVPTAQQ